MQDLPPHFFLTKVSWTSSNLQYAVLFLDDRLLFVKTGGQFAGMSKAEMIGSIAGGVLGGTVGSVAGSLAGTALEFGLRKKVRDPREKNLVKISRKDVANLLNADKKNFEILYENVIEIEIRKSIIGVNGSRLGVMSVTAEGRKKEGYDIMDDQDFGNCVETVTTFLGHKVRK